MLEKFKKILLVQFLYLGILPLLFSAIWKFSTIFLILLMIEIGVLLFVGLIATGAFILSLIDDIVNK